MESRRGDVTRDDDQHYFAPSVQEHDVSKIRPTHLSPRCDVASCTSESYTHYRCKRDKRSPKRFSAGNDSIAGPVPPYLKGLTRVDYRCSLFEDVHSTKYCG